MIQAQISYYQDKISGFKLSGHAGSGEYGHDIVCAAVSALAINTVNSLEKLADSNPVIESDEGSGFLNIKLPIDQIQHPKVQLLLESFKLGLLDIENSYDKYIEIK